MDIVGCEIVVSFGRRTAQWKCKVGKRCNQQYLLGLRVHRDRESSHRVVGVLRIQMSLQILERVVLPESARGFERISGQREKSRKCLQTTPALDIRPSAARRLHSILLDFSRMEDLLWSSLAHVDHFPGTRVIMNCLFYNHFHTFMRAHHVRLQVCRDNT